MKPESLRVLVCPACKSSLTLMTKTEDGPEVMTGLLECTSCHDAYPVVRGIPRFVGSDSYATSFGRQWKWFRTVQLDSQNGTQNSERALQAATGWRDSDYAGAMLLDAGVGAGRYAECAAKKGAQVFGVDLSSAVDAAFVNIGRLENVHLVQADIFAMPFREATFDLAYSIGVLHHTPDPRTAFERVAAVVKPRGSLAIYIYARYGIFFSDLWRKITTRLPHSLMAVITLAAIPLYYIYCLPLVGKVLQNLFPISMSPRWRERWLDTFDWYTPRYQWKYLYPEIFRWFRDNRFSEIEIFDGPIRMRGVKA
ncbi:MAG TPA: methyltransferase domain-containing protein [Thermoanaerobaculia bacterium]|nr:methyltransferase domain-containing protein [Thermoanaerobaculia bacterium]